MTGGYDTDDWRAVEAHLQRVDESTLTALVADLWDAQGFETHRDGTTVTATRQGEAVTIRVRGTGLTATAGRGADLVVVSRDYSHDGTGLGAPDLVERLRYAVEPGAARELCKRHLGAPPDELTVPLTTRLRSRLPAPEPVALVVLVGAVIITAALVAVGAVGGPGGEAPPGTETGASSGPVQPPAAGQAIPEDEATTSGVQVDPDQLPPGISTAGVADLDRLERAHEEALANTSYTIRINRTRPEIRDQELVQVRREVRISVEGEEYYAESVEVVKGQRRLLATLYHDGSETYRASMRDGGSYERVEYTFLLEDFPPSPGNLTDRVVRARLSHSRTVLSGTRNRSGERLYRIDGELRQASLGGSRVIDQESVALVRADGFVRLFRTNYSYLSGDIVVDVRRELVYDRVGETTVDPPAWYRERFAGES